MPVVLYSMTNYTSADGGSRCAASREAGSTLLNLELRPPLPRAKKKTARRQYECARREKGGGRHLCTLILDLPTLFHVRFSCLPLSSSPFVPPSSFSSSLKVGLVYWHSPQELLYVEMRARIICLQYFTVFLE